MKPTILVVGATGMLGEPVARQLQKDGYAVRVLVRSPEKARAKLGDSFEIVQGDVNDPRSLENALDGCFGVHINLRGPGLAGFELEHRGTVNIIRVAEWFDVQRLSYISCATTFEENTWDAGCKAKYQAEMAIRESGLPHSIFRPAWFMETLPLFVRGRRALVVGKQPNRLRWVAAEDYARMVSRSFGLPQAANRIFSVMGPEKFTMPQALKIYTTLTRPDVRVTVLPDWLAMRVARFMSEDDAIKAKRLAKFYRVVGDDRCDPTETNSLLGAPTTTLTQWCEAQRRGV